MCAHFGLKNEKLFWKLGRYTPLLISCKPTLLGSLIQTNQWIGPQTWGIRPTQEQSTAFFSGWPTSKFSLSKDVDHPIRLPEAFQTMNLQDPMNFGWFMDKGAINHLSTGTSNLQSVFNKCLISSILVCDGSPIPTTNTGHGVLPTSSPS